MCALGRVSRAGFYRSRRSAERVEQNALVLNWHGRASSRFTLGAAVAAARAIEQLGAKPAIKWPNDILISGKKACGLLTEMSAEQDRIRHIVLGIGIDVNMKLDALPADVRELSTTLAIETGETIDRTMLLRQILRELDRWYTTFLADEQEVLREWTSLNLTLGRRVLVSGAGKTLKGLAQRIDNDGRLIIELDDGAVHAVAAGDVTIVKR